MDNVLSGAPTYRKDTVDALLQTYRKRQYILEQQVASFGVNYAPTYLIIELEQVNAARAEIETQLGLHPTQEALACLQQLWQEALQAFYAADSQPSVTTWSKAADLLHKVLLADPSNKYAKEKLDDVEHHLSHQIFYRAIVDLRDAGQWRAVLGALDDAERRHPGFPDPDNLRDWAEAQRAEHLRQEPTGQPT